jgi:hypothetical protein
MYKVEWFFCKFQNVEKKRKKKAKNFPQTKTQIIKPSAGHVPRGHPAAFGIGGHV